MLLAVLVSVTVKFLTNWNCWKSSMIFFLEPQKILKVFNTLFKLKTTNNYAAAVAAAKSLQSCPTLGDPTDSSPPGSPSLGLSRQEHWSGLPFPSPMHESGKWKWSRSVLSDSLRPCGLSLPRSSVQGIFQARVLEWGAIAFSD